MRTTLAIDDDALEIARQYASANGRGLGKAVSELVRKAVAPPLTMRRTAAGFLVYDRPPGNVVTSEMVKEFLNEIE
jgi:hypothetical protein